ncbi:polyadenylate-specific 3'-exoribonuclease AS [Corynebacterium sp. ES2775-CONJ]|uniref:polyadenylate-specific 3'-exoribonuclease AS n=1 Tax=Corynebacterium sp. ES2775-CONJ TaxID=2974029 RepID=UPI0021683811|nr:polyadenylate-specific 3'-exoribonuclease AS [Corynebacterium sp. ES2775-CONJ]MCS4488997.1 polyadenylate-specific 3'-exoribonuclease AS [Corynebacterium sp. ES2775-CONJ]
MRFFYDTEFIEDGTSIDLVSIGIVAQTGEEFYAVSTDADHRLANAWVKEHVLNQLPNPASSVWMNNERIAAEALKFMSSFPGSIELWAWVGAYDHVVFAQLWGDMQGMPRNLPRYTRELKQYWELAGKPQLPPLPAGNHDALVDARHNLAKFQVCMAAMPLNQRNAVMTSGAMD